MKRQWHTKCLTLPDEKTPIGSRFMIPSISSSNMSNLHFISCTKTDKVRNWFCIKEYHWTSLCDLFVSFLLFYLGYYFYHVCLNTAWILSDNCTAMLCHATLITVCFVFTSSKDNNISHSHLSDAFVQGYVHLIVWVWVQHK